MDIKEEIILALFDKSTKDKVSQMFQGNYRLNGPKDRMGFELFDMDFRLYMPTQNYINFEMAVSSSIGLYSQPVGLFDKNFNIYLLNEWVDMFKTLKSTNKIDGDIKLFDIKSNAVIAAFSMHTTEIVLQIFEEFNEHGWLPKAKLEYDVMIPAVMRYDRRFICNGLDCELIFANDGYPKFYLDDKYQIPGSVCDYKEKGHGNISYDIIDEYRELINELDSLKLLTIINYLSSRKSSSPSAGASL